MRTPLIAGNWKMNTTLADAHTLANGVRTQAEHIEHIDIVLCPPAVWLSELAHGGIAPKQLPRLKLGAQNMHYKEEGAFTGETSPVMVKELAEYVILGHSERTHLFHENPELINLKLVAAFRNGLIPILCIGEDERTADSKEHLVRSLAYLVRGLTTEQLQKLVLAYEPVWAIGSGTPATPEYAQEVISALRTMLTPETRILYGGSAAPENAQGFLSQPDIDGLLIGGASLKLKSFLTMCQIADDLAAK
ncbi:MAG: triose-phosphate isomerase [bacterium]